MVYTYGMQHRRALSYYEFNDTVFRSDDIAVPPPNLYLRSSTRLFRQRFPDEWCDCTADKK